MLYILDIVSSYIKFYLIYFRIPSAVAYGATGTLSLLYFTDWKAVLQYVPFYGGKFEE